MHSDYKDLQYLRGLDIWNSDFTWPG